MQVSNLIHYRPKLGNMMQCGKYKRTGVMWTANLDEVTCEKCRTTAAALNEVAKLREMREVGR